MPNLLIIFDRWSRVRHRQRQGLHRGGRANNQSGGNADAVASHVLAMVLMLSAEIIQTDHAMRRGTIRDRTAFMGSDIHGRTIGIVGLGNVGWRVADLCRGLFGMQVIACDPYLDEATVAARGATKVTLDQLLRGADFVSINCPLDDGTRGMIEQEFALMLPHAYFITTARGFIHDEGALADALRSKKIAGAGLDVWDKELPAARASVAAVRQRARESAHRRRNA